MQMNLFDVNVVVNPKYLFGQIGSGNFASLAEEHRDCQSYRRYLHGREHMGWPVH